MTIERVFWAVAVDGRTYEVWAVRYRGDKLLTLETSCGLTLNRLSKGLYEVVHTGEQITSTDSLAI